MFKKSILPAVVIAASQLGMLNHGSTMEKSEKTPESKIDLPEDKSKLTEKEKKRLIQNRMVIEEAMKQQFGENSPKDVRDVISASEYALARTFKLKCPTPEESKLGAIVGNPSEDQKKMFAATQFTNKDGLVFNWSLSLRDILNRMGNFNGVTVKQYGDFKYGDFKGGSQVNISRQILVCGYNIKYAGLVFEVPDGYDLTFDKEKFEISQVGGVREFTSDDPTIEFTLTPKVTSKK